jgi:hypothetical protein
MGGGVPELPELPEVPDVSPDGVAVEPVGGVGLVLPAT